MSGGGGGAVEHQIGEIMREHILPPVRKSFLCSYYVVFRKQFFYWTKKIGKNREKYLEWNIKNDSPERESFSILAVGSFEEIQTAARST